MHVHLRELWRVRRDVNLAKQKLPLTSSSPADGPSQGRLAGLSGLIVAQVSNLGTSTAWTWCLLQLPGSDTHSPAPSMSSTSKGLLCPESWRVSDYTEPRQVLLKADLHLQQHPDVAVAFIAPLKICQTVQRHQPPTLTLPINGEDSVIRLRDLKLYEVWRLEKDCWDKRPSQEVLRAQSGSVMASIDA